MTKLAHVLDWEHRKWDLMTRHYNRGFTPTKFCEIPPTATFLTEKWPSTIREDLFARVPMIEEPNEIQEGQQIPGLSDFKIPDIPREIFQATSFADTDRVFNTRESTVTVPGADGCVNLEDSRMVNYSKQRYEIAKGTTPADVARLAVATQYYRTRYYSNQGPATFLILGGMAIGKTTICYHTFHLWPNQNRRAYSFQAGSEIPSRSGLDLNYTTIKTYDEIKFDTGTVPDPQFPGIMIIDEAQFAPAGAFEEFRKRATLAGFTIMLAAIPYDLNCRPWAPNVEVENTEGRVIFSLHGRCDLCSEIKSDLSAQLRDRPTQRPYSSLKPKEQWMTCCVFCCMRYFPFCHLTQDQN